MAHVIIIRYCGCSSFLCSPKACCIMPGPGPRAAEEECRWISAFAGAQSPPVESFGGKPPAFVRPVLWEQRHAGCLCLAPLLSLLARGSPFYPSWLPPRALMLRGCSSMVRGSARGLSSAVGPNSFLGITSGGKPNWGWKKGKFKD